MDPRAAGADAGTADSAPVTTEPGPTPSGTGQIPPKPTRPPRRRAPKLDELLAGAIEEARSALTSGTGLAADGQIGSHVRAVAEDDRLVTHRFAASLPGYGGWEWFATLARAPRSKVVTVCEVGLLPGEGAILAPDWVPWSERVNQEEKIRLDAIAAGEDPEKALARARAEAGEEPGPEDDDGDGREDGEDGENRKAQDRAAHGRLAEDSVDQDAGTDVTDEVTDADDVDAGPDAADADEGTGHAQPS